jgi:hypothetical protein
MLHQSGTTPLSLTMIGGLLQADQVHTEDCPALLSGQDFTGTGQHFTPMARG